MKSLKVHSFPKTFDFQFSDCESDYSYLVISDDDGNEVFLNDDDVDILIEHVKESRELQKSSLYFKQ